MNQAYLWWMLGSALITAGAHFFLARGLKKRGLLTALTCLLGSALGVVCAKAAYCLIEIDYVLSDGILETLLSDNIEYTSFYGGAAGVILGAILAAKFTGNRAVKALNAYAPAGALMAALARFGEYFLGILRAGRYVEEGPLCFFPLTIKNEWDEYYVAVFMIAGIAYLAVAVVSLVKFKEKRFVRTLYYLCLPQIICESLRSISLIWTEFVRVEQLLCMIVMEVILVLYGVWAGKKAKNRFLPALVGLLCAGVFVAAEFALDKTNLPHVVTYGVMALFLGVLAWMECLGFAKIRKGRDN